jgi:hypothetical protein
LTPCLIHCWSACLVFHSLHIFLHFQVLWLTDTVRYCPWLTFCYCYSHLFLFLLSLLFLLFLFLLFRYSHSYVVTLLLFNNDLRSHQCNNVIRYNCCLWYDCGICYSLGHPADVRTCDVAWRVPLECQCTPKSTPFQSCSILVSEFLCSGLFQTAKNSSMFMFHSSTVFLIPVSNLLDTWLTHSSLVVATLLSCTLNPSLWRRIFGFHQKDCIS